MHSPRSQNRRNLGVLARGVLDSQFAAVRKAELLPLPGGSWVRAIRHALGMTTGQLAKRVRVSQPRITAIEKAEANGSITLKTLRLAAEGLNCTLVYVLLPNEPLNAMVRERAERTAAEQLSRTHQTMKLENQALESGPLKREHMRLVDELLRGDPRRLWDVL
jgi:predicted DNA-binding mobile mystery protein A